LELYCVTYEQWLACVEEVRKHGVMVDAEVTDSSGEAHTKRVINPAGKLGAQLHNALRQMLKEFAATPASREKAKPAKPAPTKKKEPKPGTVAWILAHAEDEPREPEEQEAPETLEDECDPNK
jgi:P27 family predicted phage terminase small subunit